MVSRNPPNSLPLTEAFPKLIPTRTQRSLCSSTIPLCGSLFRGLLLEQLVLQLVRQALGMLRAVLLRNMNVTLSSSSSVEVLSLHARSQRYLGDGNLVLALRSFDSWRADVGNASSSSAESSIVVITNNSFADNFAVTITIWVLVSR